MSEQSQGAKPDMPVAQASGGRKGPLAWMARNSVAANILMLFLLVGGYFQMSSVKQEVFPEFDLDLILMTIPYPGASPEEVEKGVLLAAEEAVRGIDGVKEVRSYAYENVATVAVELMLGTDPDQALDKVQSAIGRVNSFPDAVRQEGAIDVFRATFQREVISLVIYGDSDERSLRFLAEQARQDLLADDRITSVEIAGTRPLEISVEVSQAKLRELGLTHAQVAAAIRVASIEVPGGGIKTPGGEVLLRSDERSETGEQFARIAVLSRPDGSVLRLGQVAEVKDGFADTDQSASFNGKPAVMVRVFRTGEQTPLEISAAVKDYVNSHVTAAPEGQQFGQVQLDDGIVRELPKGIAMATWFDTSDFYRQRIGLLKRNAIIGLVLVMLVLGLFLEVKLAFWVTLGIPVCFVGAFLFLPSTDMSINMISLFAFIVVLGMVVDDAIIVGEAIYKKRQEGAGHMAAAIAGVREVAAPVCFAILTTMFAYMPMLFVPGASGKFFRVIPIVVIIVLALSLIESLLILPAHLAHSQESKGGIFGAIGRVQSRFGRAVERFIEGPYQRLARFAVRRKYATLALGLATLIGSVGLVAGGRINFTFMPRVDSDVVVAAASMPYGTSVDRTREVETQMLAAAREILEDIGGVAEMSKGMFSQVGAHGLARTGPPGGEQFSSGGSHLVETAVYMVGSDKRPIRSAEFARRWRKKLSERVFGVETLNFSFATGPSPGKPIDIELSHRDIDYLRKASTFLADKLTDFAGTYDINDGFAVGKRQISYVLTPHARSLGLTARDLAQQIRDAFFGAEAVRQQRGRDEVRVYVRLPKRDRESEYSLENFMVRTPAGGEIPFREAATVERGRAYTEITRTDGRRAVKVTSEVDNAVGNAGQIMGRVFEEVVPELSHKFPGIKLSVGGEQKEQAEVFASLKTGFLLAVIGMFALLAIAFRSYVQPFIVMLAIPFGAVGALWGHIIMGYDLSLMSMMGIVALAGIVVNDSLILVVAVNRYRERGMAVEEAVVAGGVRRFRPIVLTSLTTFFGLAPMIVATEVQAKFLIPMAVSLGFGVMAATFITLLLVPAAYAAVEENAASLSRSVRSIMGEPSVAHTGAPEPAADDPDA